MKLSKADRETVRMKFGGKCAYCGCDLPERWHADHFEPVVRELKFRQRNDGTHRWLSFQAEEISTSGATAMNSLTATELLALTRTSIMDGYDTAVEQMDTAADAKSMHRFRERVRKLEVVASELSTLIASAEGEA